MTILDAIMHEHYFYSLLVLYLMDKSTVFPTFFEVMVFIICYTFHSFVIASEQLIFEFNKKVRLRDIL